MRGINGSKSKALLTALLVALLFIGLQTQLFAGPLNEPQNLSKKKLQHFELYSEETVSDEELLNMRRNLINVRRAVGRSFGNFFPKKKFKVIVTSQQTFQAYTKTGDHIAGLFDGRIHIPSIEKEKDTPYLQAILWHEYTHACTWLLSRGKCPIWLNEGLAVYHEEQAFPRRLQELKEIEPEYLLSINELSKLFTGGFNQNKEILKRAYLSAYLAAAYLNQRYSAKSVKGLLEDLATGQSLDEVLRKKFGLSVEELDRHTLEYLIQVKS